MTAVRFGARTCGCFRRIAGPGAATEFHLCAAHVVTGPPLWDDDEECVERFGDLLPRTDFLELERGRHERRIAKRRLKEAA